MNNVLQLDTGTLTWQSTWHRGILHVSQKEKKIMAEISDHGNSMSCLQKRKALVYKNENYSEAREKKKSTDICTSYSFQTTNTNHHISRIATDDCLHLNINVYLIKMHNGE